MPWGINYTEVEMMQFRPGFRKERQKQGLEKAIQTLGELCPMYALIAANQQGEIVSSTKGHPFMVVGMLSVQLDRTKAEAVTKAPPKEDADPLTAPTA